MEETLDDALNVLRNHCEPQLGLPIPGLDGNTYVGTSPVTGGGGGGGSGGGVSSIPSETSAVEPPPIKQERVPGNTSMIFVKHIHWLKFIFNTFFFNSFPCIIERRKEPPDSDTKPSSSVEGSAKGTGGKRARR